jgi:hypothetical protein
LRNLTCSSIANYGTRLFSVPDDSPGDALADYPIIIDNATGKTVITDENQLVLRADPNDHLHYDHKEHGPLPPPAQG